MFAVLLISTPAMVVELHSTRWSGVRVVSKLFVSANTNYTSGWIATAASTTLASFKVSLKMIRMVAALLISIMMTLVLSLSVRRSDFRVILGLFVSISFNHACGWNAAATFATLLVSLTFVLALRGV